ncbi:MAG: acetyl-CoA carboxylase biotin carboxylase subunit [Syntrophales bacterium]|nr:acetyl-CoA carboxylase biotin carboxylase subunit [Syntrophales bacterium]MDD4338603.1 acetyl-CoA carboxylase biotin carboxylase subunit [Syntrophales bacterium]HOQ43591.1 acetyl-CoA carboxylase biotin carboxylase subunit [Smithellaceae bacterium]
MKKKKVLVANRGEIAVRIIKACKDLGIETVLVVSEADRESMGAKLADEVVCIGPPQVHSSYLNIQKIIKTALETGADAIHPGYGFLAENPALPDACEKNEIIFIGPRSATMRQLGDKIKARNLARKNHVPMTEGSEGLRSFQDVEAEVQKIGFPVIFKAAAGGGGRGMRIVTEQKNLKNSFDMASNEGLQAFGDATLFVERYVQNARHVEVQVIGDNFGKVIHLGKRDCSTQRRYQKVIEEAHPPNLPDDLRSRILEAAVALTSSIGYNSAGTVEFLVDKDRNEFYFMEVNTRIQVEHPVTEEVTGIDLVKEQIQVAFGAPLSLNQEDIKFKGHAIECRITADDAKDDFMPSPGDITYFALPEGNNVRVDTHCHQGCTISPYYDSLLAKLITTGNTREEALANMKNALTGFKVEGIETNIPFLQFLVEQPEFGAGDMHINWIENTVLPKFVESIK